MARSRFHFLLAVSLLAFTGCPSQPASQVPQTNSTPVANKQTGEKAPTAREIVDSTINAYRAALGYRDRGVVKLSYKQDGEALEDSAPLEVQFAMPNRLHLKAYQAEAASDGTELRAIIRDESTANMDGQVVARPAPQKLTLDDLYSDIVLRDTLQNGLGRHPVQLELLFGDAPLLDLVKPDAKLALLEPVEIEGHPCYRVEARLADGAYVFCIDEADYLLRRIEYPAEALLPELAKNHGVTDLKIVAEFRQAAFEKQLPKTTFDLALPKDGKRVRYFVLPPQELPSNLFGKKPGDFKFDSTSGDAVTPAELAGNTTVLIWFANDPLCAFRVQQIKDALKEATAKHKVNAYMIATEDRSVSNEELAGALKEWQVDLPLLRDFHGAGPKLFNISQAPTMVILDAQGRVQIFEVVNFDLKEMLPGVLARLAAGDDLAAELLADVKKQQEEYAKNLAIASGDEAQTTVVEVAPTEPAAVREPEHFTRTKLWSSAEKQLAEPGNFLITYDRDQPRIYVLDGFRTVVELSADGSIEHKHELDLPKGAGITYLRTAVDKDGKRWFVGSSLLGKQLFVFDAEWKVKAAYPPAEQEHDGLHAVEIADLAGDGTPELYVGFWSLVGIQGVTLEGNWEWTSRVLPNVLSLVATPPNDLGWRKILASGDRGAIYRLNQFGHEDPKIEVGKRQIHRLAAANWTTPQASVYCGISYLPEGRLQAVGLNDALEEVWNYKLPPGAFNNQIEYVTSSRLRGDDQGEWLLGGPDGSVHVVSDDGEFFDSFATGEPLTGLASVKLDAARVVLTSTKSGVTAWKLEAK